MNGEQKGHGVHFAGILSAAAALLTGSAIGSKPDCQHVIAEAAKVSEVTVESTYEAVAVAACEAVASHGTTELSLAVIGLMLVAWTLHFVRQHERR